MARLVEGFVAELKNRIDIYEVVSPYVQLKKSGSSWVGLSPFSQEKTPSFMFILTRAFSNALAQGKVATLFLLSKKLKTLSFQKHWNYLLKDLIFPCSMTKVQQAFPSQHIHVR